MLSKNLFFTCLVLALLAASTLSELYAQNATDQKSELRSYLQQLETEKQQYINVPTRYKEYENKIANIKKELGISTTATDKNSTAQPAETEQARMARTLSAEDYDAWKQAQQQASGTPNATTPANKSARVLPSPANTQKQIIGGVQVITSQNGQTSAPRQRSSDGSKKEMSNAQKAIYAKYGLDTNIAKEDMIQWRKNNPSQWQAMRQDLKNAIANQNNK